MQMISNVIEINKFTLKSLARLLEVTLDYLMKV